MTHISSMIIRMLSSASLSKKFHSRGLLLFNAVEKHISLIVNNNNKCAASGACLKLCTALIHFVIQKHRVPIEIYLNKLDVTKNI